MLVGRLVPFVGCDPFGHLGARVLQKAGVDRGSCLDSSASGVIWFTFGTVIVLYATGILLLSVS